MEKKEKTGIFSLKRKARNCDDELSDMTGSIERASIDRDHTLSEAFSLFSAFLPMLPRAASGLARPKIPCFDAVCSSPHRSPGSLRRERAAEQRKSPFLKATACKAVVRNSSDGDGRFGACDLDLRDEKKKPPTVLDGGGLRTQEAVYDALAELAVELLLSRRSGDERVVVELAGGPGSGKSTAAAAVVARVNALWKERRKNADDDESEEIAVVLPMDGYHLTRAQLSASVDPSPEEMFARRGAHWTFDGDAFVKTVEEVVVSSSSFKSNNPETAVLAPSFDHGVGDPCPGAIAIRPQHRLVLAEGNYLLLPQEPWSRLLAGKGKSSPSLSRSRPLFDQTWFLDVPVDTAMERVRRRQVAVGVPEEVSRRRIEGNDRPNGELVASTKSRADVVVRGDLPMMRSVEE